MIPQEVPQHSVPHDFEDEAEEGLFLASGTVKDREWWGTPTQHKEELKDLRRKERARAALGGFGFRSAG